MKNEQPTPSNMSNQIADILFPQVIKTIADYRKIYPPRTLREGAEVTRIAPSPTGHWHIGGLYMAMICRKFARQSCGVFYLRIEDTDKKREVPGAKEAIIESLKEYGLSPDEGPTLTGDAGMYAPYTQSARSDIYQSFVKELVAMGFAYPCFTNETQLASAKKKQKKLNITPHY